MSRTVAAGKLALRDYEPERAQFRDDALAGLCEPPKTLPCKYFYDETGSRLFDEICELDEYYPTRTELSIMRDHAAAMGGTLGPNVLLIEYGSGSSLKTRLLLDHLDAPAGYVPVDISREHLRKSAEALAADFPGLRVGSSTSPARRSATSRRREPRRCCATSQSWWAWGAPF
jgi:uncharacterized SAM-dependent methyltransferase